MKFVLNEYHRDISTDEILLDIKNVALFLGKNTITIDEYNFNGKYHSTTIRKRVGSWKKALELAGLEVNNHHFYIEDEEYIRDLQSVARKLEKTTITTSEYSKHGFYDAQKLSKRFGGWNKALGSAGLQPTGYTISVSDQELLSDIEKTWIRLGRQPTTSDIKAGLSAYGLTTYIRHFGSWRKSLERFVEYINLEDESTEQPQPSHECILKNESIDYKHKTRRDINLRMRFKIMKRDSFRCRLCGASPSSDPLVELHIDHIIPWSKGGETVMENLQTLCSKCNLGKSNLTLDE